MRGVTTPAAWLAVVWLAVVWFPACAPLPQRPPRRSELWGFTAPWDPRSAASVAQHGAQLDVLVSGWIALDSATFQPVALFPDTFVTPRASAPTAAPTAVPPVARRAMALVTSYQGGRFHPETVRALAADSIAMAHAAGAIAAAVRTPGYRGVVLDLEGMTPSDLVALSSFTRAVADSVHARGVSTVALAIPATDTAAYPARLLLAHVDYLVVMLYDQHWLTSPPGPIAAPDWVRRVLAVRIGEVGTGKLVAAFPTYGYAWRPDSATAVVSYDDARRRAAEGHAALERDPASATLHATVGGRSIWVSDAVLLDSLVRDAQAGGVTRFALWRLGLEDPAVWPLLARPGVRSALRR